MAKKKKKSWKKKLLKAALIGGALYGGSKLLGRRKKASMESMDDAGIGVTHGTNWIKRKEKPVIKTEVEPKIDYSKGNWKGFGHPLVQGNIQKKNEYIKRNTIPGYGSAAGPPSELNPYKTPFKKTSYRSYQGKTGGRVAAKKGGRVTGIAKRGFGRALMKGKK